MEWIIFVCAAELFALAPPCSSAASCAHLRVKASVLIGGGELTLADLLAANTCARYRQAAAEVSLGPAPLASSVRVLDGGQVRRRFEALAAAVGTSDELVEEMPANVVVRRAGGAKSCAEIAGLALRSLSQEHGAGISQESFDCAAAWSVPEDAPLEITKTAWNPALARWEFSMRCTRARDCVPFLVWARENHKKISGDASAPFGNLPISSSVNSSFADSSGERLIKPGQTATLRWDEGGIRIVLPVTCLDGGRLGQTVRVQFKNARRILRAEILSDGTLRAGL